MELLNWWNMWTLSVLLLSSLQHGQGARWQDVDMREPPMNTLAGFMSVCGNSSSDPTVFKTRLPSTCNAACSLLLLEQSVRFAEAIGATAVELEGFDGSASEVATLFDFPRRIPVRKGPMQPCDFVPGAKQADYCQVPALHTGSFCKAPLVEKRQVFADVILPYLRKEVLNACPEPPDSEIALHIRNGKGARTNTGPYGQPPCAYYETVLRTGYDSGPFKRVRLVMAPAKGDVSRTRSVCYDELLRSWAPGKDLLLPGMDAAGVQRGSGSLTEDFCHLLKAKNLVVPPSDFNQVAFMLNHDVKRFYHWMPDTRHEDPALVQKLVHDHNFDHAEVCQVVPQSVQFRISDSVVLKPNPGPHDWGAGESDRPESKELHERVNAFFKEYPATMLPKMRCNEPFAAVQLKAATRSQDVPANTHEWLQTSASIGLACVLTLGATRVALSPSSSHATLAAALSMSQVVMFILNQYLAMNFPALVLLLMLQMLVADLVTMVLGFHGLKVPCRQEFLRWLAVPCLFSGLLASSMFAMKEAALSAVIVFRSQMPLWCILAEKFLLGIPIKSPSRVAAIILTLSGVMIYGYTIGVSFTWIGVVLLATNCVILVADRLWQSWIFKHEDFHMPLPTCQFMNNVFGIVPLVGLAFLHGESRTWHDILVKILPQCWPMVIVSGLSGVSLGLLGLRCQQIFSATTFLMLQQFSRLQVITLSVFLFSHSLSLPAAAGCGISLAGCVWYGCVTWAQARGGEGLSLRLLVSKLRWPSRGGAGGPGQPAGAGALPSAPTRQPPFVVSVVCLASEFLYLASYSIAIPQSYSLTLALLRRTLDSVTPLEVNLISGALIGLQHLAFGLAIYYCKYRHRGSERSIISCSLGFSMLGSGLFMLGAAGLLEPGASLALLLVARLVQGMGSGVDYTAKRCLTVLSSSSELSRYYSYWSIACACGTGFGPILVFAATCLPGFAALPVGLQSALPLLLLLFWQAALLSLHLVYFPLQLDGAAGKGGSKAHEVMPLVREDRLAKVFTAIFLGFIRHLVRTAWEAVSVLALQQEHRCSMQQATCVIALFYFLSYPVQMLYSRNRERLSEEGWMRLMVILAGAGAILLMLDSANSNGIFIFVIGSMLMYCALAVHATVSDSVGVRFADDSDALLNVENVIFMQVIAKGLIGRLMGPLAGRLSVVGGHFEGFAMLSLSLLVVSEVLTVFVIAGGKRNLDMMTALFSDGHAQALHTLTSTNLNDFLGSEDGREFARLKHGDVDVLRRAADSLAQLIIANERIRSMFAQDAQQVRIISPAYRNVPTAGVYLVRFLQEKLSELVGAPVVSCQVRRKKVSNGDFAAMTVAQRTKTLSQQFFIEEEQAVELHSKFCIFVDDAVVYGSHYLETCRMLSGHGVDCKNIFSVFIVRATEELLAKVPDAEHRLNERFPKDAASLQAVMSAPHFGATVRVIRLVLALQEQEFQALVHWLQVEKPELLRALSWGAMVESLKDSDRLPFLEPTDAASRV